MAVAGAVVAVVVAAEGSPFEVLDVLHGAVELVRPTATLDGSIPLRAAQACSPLLDGNQFGFQVTLRERVELDRSLTGVRLSHAPPMLLRALSGAVPRLFAEGLLDPRGRWPARLSRGLVHRERTRDGRHRLSIFTGLLVRARPGIWLRIGHAGNRRNLLFDVEECWVADDGRFAPLVVTLSLMPGTRLPLSLFGEIATLAPLAADVHVERAKLSEASETAHAHMSFFDQRYFSQKKNTPTRKYRRVLANCREGPRSATATLRVADAGPAALSVVSPSRFLTWSGVDLKAPAQGKLEGLEFQNAIALSARFDGHNTWVTPARDALEQYASETESIWRAALDDAELESHPGALWYFTKYVTLHQSGEPYFFVKPAALIQTPPGWSVLIEGVAAAHFSVLRGVVATDVFHAMPAVIRVDHPGRELILGPGLSLTRIYAFPRWLSGLCPEIVDWSFVPRRVGAG